MPWIFKTTLMAIVATVTIATAARGGEGDEWVARSNDHAQILLDLIARFQPEGASRLGVEGLDGEILDLGPRIYERRQVSRREALAKLKKALGEEPHPKVRQDLEILIKSTENEIRSAELERRHLLPYSNVAQTVFMGFLQTFFENQQ